jgi:hypothetical protein
LFQNPKKSKQDAIWKNLLRKAKVKKDCFDNDDDILITMNQLPQIKISKD